MRVFFNHLANANKPDFKFVTSLFVYLSQIVSMLTFTLDPQPALRQVVKVENDCCKTSSNTVQVILHVKDSDV